MKILRIAAEGFHSLGLNKLRTFFMMAGTIVGVAALVVIMAERDLGTLRDLAHLDRVPSAFQRQLGGDRQHAVASSLLRARQRRPARRRLVVLLLADGATLLPHATGRGASLGRAPERRVGL